MHKVLRIALWAIAFIVALLVAAVVAGFLAMRGSLPTLDGDIKLTALSAPVSVTRDAQGTVAITAKAPLDAARALGYVHGQERFFEMDLTRRSAAGELSALLGAATLPMDKDKRRHRMRARMERQLASTSPEEHSWLTAYADGVNQGVAALSVRPWQYLLLRTQPEAWREVDSLLVVSEMYFMLQAGGYDSRYTDIRLRALLGDRLFDWMRPLGGEWDAALDGSSIAQAALPTPAELDTRKAPMPAKTAASLAASGVEAPSDRELMPGSNNWAVGGTRTAHGGATLADDMHLGLGVPGIWFRAQMTIGGDKPRRISGVTLPGLPSIVVGSNGDVAWGFTNSYGQWFDWVAIPKSGASAAAIEVRTQREVIAVKGGDSVELNVRETAFGPVLREDTGHEYALSWVLYRDGAVNGRAYAMMFATNIDDAITIAQESGIPHQNAVIADRAGNIAWTIMGRMPQREKPQAKRGMLATPAELPQAWLPIGRYPLVKNPADGQLWTANSRQLGTSAGALIGEGSFDLGARAAQIRDRLRETPKFDEQALYGVQLDDESRFLKRWAELVKTLPARDAKVDALTEELKRWNGRADVSQTGHRIARAVRQRIEEQLWQSWLATADAGNNASEPPDKRYAGLPMDARFEYAAWQALTAKPIHLLPQPFKSWDEFIAAKIGTVHDELVKQHGSLKDATWGKRNTARIKHPFSRAMPFLSSFLDMPPDAMAGDNHMPRVAAPGFGASQRLVVSPGREEQAIMTMAGGQSGHPLSPFYGAGHRDWLAGKPAPLLAGEAKHTLRFNP